MKTGSPVVMTALHVYSDLVDVQEFARTSATSQRVLLTAPTRQSGRPKGETDSVRDQFLRGGLD